MTRTNKIRTGLTALAVSLTALAGFGGAASAAGGTPTKVTIQAESGGFHGYVKSANPNCVEGRTVALYQQLGSRQNPRTDLRVLTDTAEEDGEWNTGNPGLRSGRFYARATRAPGCKPANSRTIPARP
jgi:hypothetical protein